MRENNPARKAIRARQKKIKKIKNKITKTRLTRYHQILVDIIAHMNENQQRMNDINQEPGASSWT